jgi:hypothetical protein
MWRIRDVRFVWAAVGHIDRALLSETSVSFTIFLPPDIARQAGTTARAVSATFSSGGFQ